METVQRQPFSGETSRSDSEEQIIEPTALGPQIIDDKGGDHTKAFAEALNRGNIVEPIAVSVDESSDIIRWKIKLPDGTEQTAISMLAVNATKPMPPEKPGSPDSPEAPNKPIGLPLVAVDTIMNAHARAKTKPKLKLTPFNPKYDESGKLLPSKYCQAEFLDTVVTTKPSTERIREQRVTSVQIGKDQPPIPVQDTKTELDLMG